MSSVSHSQISDLSDKVAKISENSEETVKQNLKTIRIIKHNAVLFFVSQWLNIAEAGDIKLGSFCEQNNLLIAEEFVNLTPDMVTIMSTNAGPVILMMDVKVSDSSNSPMDRNMVNYSSASVSISNLNDIKCEYIPLLFTVELMEFDEVHRILVNKINNLQPPPEITELKSLVRICADKINRILKFARDKRIDLNESSKFDVPYDPKEQLSEEVVRQVARQLIGIAGETEQEMVDLVFGKGRYFQMTTRFTDQDQIDLEALSSELKPRVEARIQSNFSWNPPSLSEDFEDKLDEKISKLGYPVMTAQNYKKRPILPLPFFAPYVIESDTFSEYNTVRKAISYLGKYIEGELGILLREFDTSVNSPEAISLFNSSFNILGQDAEMIYTKIRKEDRAKNLVSIKGPKKISMPKTLVVDGLKYEIRSRIEEDACVNVKRRQAEADQDMTEERRKEETIKRRQIKRSPVRLLSQGGEEAIDKLAHYFSLSLDGRRPAPFHSMYPSDTLSAEPTASIRMRDDARDIREPVDQFFFSSNLFRYTDYVSRIYSELLFMGSQSVDKELVISSAGFADFLIVMAPGRSLTETDTKRSFKIICAAPDESEEIDALTKDYSVRYTYDGKKICETPWLKVTPESANHYSKMRQSVYAVSVGQLIELPTTPRSRVLPEEITHFLGYVPIMAFCNKRQTSSISQLSRYVTMAALSLSADLEQGMLDKLSVPVRNVYEVWLIKRMIECAKECLSGVAVTTIEELYRSGDEDDIMKSRFVMKVPRTSGCGHSLSLSSMVSDFYLANTIDKTETNRNVHTQQVINDIMKAQYKHMLALSNGKKLSELSEVERLRREMCQGRSNDKEWILPDIIDQNVEHICFDLKAISLGAKLSLEKLNPQKITNFLNDKVTKPNLLNLSNTASVVEERPAVGEFKNDAELREYLKNLRRKLEKDKADSALGKSFRKTKRLNRRIKNMELILSRYLSDDPTGLIPNLDSLAFPIINSTLLPFANFVSKEQIGSSRDIAIQDAETKISNAFCEYLSRAICSLFPSEMLTHKGKFDKQRKMASTFRKGKEKILFLNADNTKWGPHMIPIQFIPLFHSLRPYFSKNYLDHCCFQMLKMTKKIGEMPIETVKFLSQEFLIEEMISDEIKILLNHVKKGETTFEMNISMWQGILHYTSSWSHVSRLDLQDALFDTMYPELRSSFNRTHQVSSDDRGSCYKIESIDGYDWEKQVRIYGIIDRFAGRAFNHKFNEMKSCLSAIIYEFNSNFMCEGSASSALMKFLATISVMPPTANYDADVRFMLSTISQIDSQGCSLTLLQLLIDLGRYVINDLYRTGTGMFNSIKFDGKEVPQGLLPIQLGGYPNMGPLLSKISCAEAHTWLLAESTNVLNKSGMTTSDCLKKLFCHEGSMENLPEDSDPTLMSRRLQPRGVDFKVRQIRHLEVMLEKQGLSLKMIREQQERNPFSLFLSPRTKAAARRKEINKFGSAGIENTFSRRSTAATRVLISKIVKKAVCNVKGSTVSQTTEEWRERIDKNSKELKEGNFSLAECIERAEINAELNRKSGDRMTFMDAVNRIIGTDYSEESEKYALNMYKAFQAEINPYLTASRNWLNSINWTGLEETSKRMKFALRTFGPSHDFLSLENEPKQLLAHMWKDAWNNEEEERDYTWRWDNVSVIDLDWKCLKLKIPWVKDSIKETKQILSLHQDSDLKTISDTMRAIEKSLSSEQKFYITAKPHLSFEETLESIAKKQFCPSMRATFVRVRPFTTVRISETRSKKGVVLGSDADLICRLLSGISKVEQMITHGSRAKSRAMCYKDMSVTTKINGRQVRLSAETIINLCTDSIEKEIYSANKLMWRYLMGVKEDLQIKTETSSSSKLRRILYTYTKKQLKFSNGIYDKESDGEVLVRVNDTIVRVCQERRTISAQTNSIDSGSTSLAVRIGSGLLRTQNSGIMDLIKHDFPQELIQQAGNIRSGFCFDRNTGLVYREDIKPHQLILNVQPADLDSFQGVEILLDKPIWDPERLELYLPVSQGIRSVLYRSPRVMLSWSTHGVNFTKFRDDNLWGRWSLDAIHCTLGNDSRTEISSNQQNLDLFLKMSPKGEYDLNKTYTEFSQEGILEAVNPAGSRLRLADVLGVNDDMMLPIERRNRNRMVSTILRLERRVDLFFRDRDVDLITEEEWEEMKHDLMYLKVLKIIYNQGREEHEKYEIEKIVDTIKKKSGIKAREDLNRSSEEEADDEPEIEPVQSWADSRDEPELESETEFLDLTELGQYLEVGDYEDFEQIDETMDLVLGNLFDTKKTSYEKVYRGSFLLNKLVMNVAKTLKISSKRNNHCCEIAPFYLWWIQNRHDIEKEWKTLLLFTLDKLLQSSVLKPVEKNMTMRRVVEETLTGGLQQRFFEQLSGINTTFFNNNPFTTLEMSEKPKTVTKKFLESMFGNL